MGNKLTLNDVGNLQNESSVVTTLALNNRAIETAIENTLSRDGSSPNPMQSNLDMNSKRIINLPSPIGGTEPVRLIDIANGSVDISGMPAGGTTGQVTTKASNADYDVVWQSLPVPVVISPATNAPIIDGTATVGVSVKYAREDHVHPTDTTRADATTTTAALALKAPLASPALTGTPTAPTATVGTNTTQLATTAFVLANASTSSSPYVSVLTQDPTIDSTGATNTAAKLQTAITAINTAGKVSYIPQGIYACGSTQVTIPDNAHVELHPNAIIRRTADPASAVNAFYGSYTGAMISLGNHCVWRGGVLDNNVVTATSSTSQAIATGAKTFTVGTGLPFIAGDFLRFQSRANGANHMEGTVTSYSGTSLVMNIQFAAGTATLTDWNINYGAVYHCPMVLHNVTETIVEEVRVTGIWYVGLLMDGWNPSGGGTNVTQFCTFRNCWLEGVQNRAIYLYGNVRDDVIESCFIDGATGITDYGVNINPANPTGTANAAVRLKILSVSINGTGFQGVALGDYTNYVIVSDCTASGLTQAASVAFLVQQANAGVAQYNTVSNCTASNCQGMGFETAGALYIDFVGCQAVSCYRGFMFTSQSGASTYCTARSCRAIASQFAGFYITGSSVDISLENISSIANSGVGIAIDAGCTNSLLTGRSTANVGAALSNLGTGTVSTGLITV